MIAVTSPVTVSDEAKAAQQRLKRNTFEIDFLEGPVDEAFGPECGRACVRAKLRIGYAAANAKPVYGKTLDDYLSGAKPQTARMKERAKERRQDRLDAARVKVLTVARREVGTVEAPAGSNKTKYGKWYGVDGVAWCAIFTSWVYSQVELFDGVFRPGSRWAFCPFVVNAAVAGEHGLDQVREPIPGDLVLYQFDDDSNADHIGIFEGWTDKASGRFTAIEGNTSLSSNANGGQVMRRDRNTSQVYRPRTGGLAFVRVHPTKAF